MLWGPGWDQTNDQLQACAQEGGRWLSRDEERDIYLRASLVVNLHQDSGREGAPDFINPRTFLLAALGVPQVLEDRLELAPLFDLTNELTVFRPATDLSSLVRELLQNPEKREKRAQRAKERALGAPTSAQGCTASRHVGPSPRRLFNTFACLPVKLS